MPIFLFGNAIFQPSKIKLIFIIILFMQVCEQCPNIRLITEDQEIDITIAAGMEHGTLLKYPG